MFIEIVEEQETFELEMGESVFELRRFDSAVYHQIEKKHTTRKKNHRTGVVTKEVDEYAANADLLDHMITGWRNVKSPMTGEDVLCTYESKQKLPSNAKVQIIEACDGDSITGNEKKKGKGGTS